jgi:N-dimethylarginine dimethylaminohydrolase
MLKKVLMCKPNFFRVDYQINPWMKIGSVDSKKALKQWENLVKVYQKNDIKVEVIEQNEDFPDMVFSADQGLVLANQNNKNSKKTILLSNFRYIQRQGETIFYKNWFEKNNFEIEVLADNFFFEGGGEILPWENKYFIGQGFRNTDKTINYLNQKLNFDFIPLELINPNFYHLDTCMFVLNTETIFYYPPAFSENSIKVIKSLIKNPIEFSQKEALGFAANSVLSGQKIFVQSGNETFVKKLNNLNYEIIEVDVSEFVKSGGGIHCLTFEIDRVGY